MSLSFVLCQMQLSLRFDDVSVYSDTLGGPLLRFIFYLLALFIWVFDLLFPFYHQFVPGPFRWAACRHHRLSRRLNDKYVLTTKDVEFHLKWPKLNADVDLLHHFALNIYPGVYWLGVGQILETVSITGKKQHKTHTKNKQQATSDKKTSLSQRQGIQQKLQHCRTWTEGLLSYDLLYSLRFIRWYTEANTDRTLDESFQTCLMVEKWLV